MPYIPLCDDVVAKFVAERPQTEVYDSLFRGPGSFGVRVNRGGKKSFFVVYRLRGRRSRLTIGTFPATNTEDARKRAMDLVTRVDAGEDPAASRLRMNFGQVVEIFLHHHVKKTLKPTTAHEYERILRKEILPRWGGYDLRTVGSEEISHFLTQVALGRGSGTMANRIRGVVGSFFGFAVERGLIATNPVPDAPPPSRERQGERVLSFAEIEELMVELGKDDHLLSGILQFTTLTGQNSGEVCAMRWADIRLDSWTVGGISRHPPHEIYLVPHLMGELRKLKGKTGRFDFVFGNESGGFTKHLGRYVNDLNQRLNFDAPFSPRDIRRSFQYRIRELGIRPDVIEKLQARSTSVPKRLRPYHNFDYSPDIRDALIKWAERILPAPIPPKKGAKVIQLFR